MDIHVQLDAFASSHTVQLGFQRLGLDTVACRRTLVVYIARRCAGATALVPVARPIAIDVSTDATCRGSCLAILAPHTVVSLGKGEAIWIDDREDVEVVSILERSGCGVVRGEELVGCVLDNLTSLVCGV